MDEFRGDLIWALREMLSSLGTILGTRDKGIGADGYEIKLIIYLHIEVHALKFIHVLVLVA